MSSNSLIHHANAWAQRRTVDQRRGASLCHTTAPPPLPSVLRQVMLACRKVGPPFFLSLPFFPFLFQSALRGLNPRPSAFDIFCSAKWVYIHYKYRDVQAAHRFGVRRAPALPFWKRPAEVTLLPLPSRRFPSNMAFFILVSWAPCLLSVGSVFRSTN